MPSLFRFFQCTVFSICLFSTHSIYGQQLPALAPNYLHLPTKAYELPFHWQGDSTAAGWEPHAALLLPITLTGCAKVFYLQFDTGAPSTLLYKNKLQEIHRQFPKTVSVSDTATALLNYTFKLDAMSVEAARISLINYPGEPINWSKGEAKVIIGTLGADFIDARAIVIDYPRQRFYNGTALPTAISATTAFSKFMFMRRSVLLPSLLNGKSTLLFFDAGSSAFPLLTNKQTAEAMAVKDSEPVRYAVRSWNRTLTANVFATNDSITVAGQSLPLKTVSYMDGASDAQIAQMMKMGIGGMTSNKLFLHCRLVMDVKASTFAVLPQR